MSLSFAQEDIRDLINDSSISNISIIGRAHNGGSPAVNSGPNPRRKRGANTPKMAAAASPASGGPRRGLKESLSQISLRTQRSLRSSMKRTAPPSAAAEPSVDEAAKRVKVGRIEPMDGVTETTQNGGAEVNGESQGELIMSYLNIFILLCFLYSSLGPQSRQNAKLFLQSSARNWAQASVPPPPLVRGGPHSLGGEGLGESQFRRGDIHCGILYI